ncbi:MAG: flagellar basal body-associated FliL family protein [Sulfitobacter sp.]
MKKTVAILAVSLLCIIAAFAGVTLAIGADNMRALAGLSTDAPSDVPAETLASDHADADAEGAHGEAADGHGAAADTQGKMPVMPFPEIIVNVTDTSMQGRQSSRFLKLNMLMVFDDTREGAERLVAREIYLRDSFQDFLRQLHVSDLKGSHGLAMMKTELLRRARAVGHTEAPIEILIADMVIQ